MSGISYKKLLTILIGAKTNVSFIFLLISLLLGMEKKYLEGIGVKVRGEDTHFVVEYHDEVYSGECIYEVVNLKGKNKPINQVVYVIHVHKHGMVKNSSVLTAKHFNGLKTLRCIMMTMASLRAQRATRCTHWKAMI